MNLENLNIAVVGGAIGGASAALLFATRGAAVTCFERVAEPRTVGAGIAFQPNGVAVLAGLGLAPAIEARAARLESPHIVDSRGKTLLAPHLPADAAGFDRLLMIRRRDLHEILFGALAAIWQRAYTPAGAVLGEELARAETLESALLAYDRRRQPAVSKVQRAAETLALGWLSERTNPALRFLRDGLFKTLSSRGDEQRMRDMFQEPPAELFRMAAPPIGTISTRIERA